MPKRDDHYAILMAITRYPGIGDLNGPENDAEAFRTWLLDPAGGNLDASHVVVIRSSDFPAATNPDDASPTENEFKKVLNTWCKDRKREWREDRVGARLYLFFAGHGFTAGLSDNPALFTAQAQNGDTVHIAGLQYALKIRNAGFFGEIVLVMDCCQDVLKTARVNEPTWNPPDRNAADDVLMMTAFAAPRGKQSRESSANPGPARGYFTSVFTEALRNAPPDKAGNVTAEAVAAAVLDAWEGQGYIQKTGVNHPPISAPHGMVLYRRDLPVEAAAQAQKSSSGAAIGQANKSPPLQRMFSILTNIDIDNILGSPDLTGGQSSQETCDVRIDATVQSRDAGAFIRILDAGRRELAAGTGPLHAKLQPGDYIARFRVGDAVKDLPFEVKTGGGPVEIEDGLLEFSSPVPMPETSTDRFFHYDQAMDLGGPAVQRAYQSEFPANVGTLMVFARDTGHVPGTDWAMPAAIRAGLRLRKLDEETGRPGVVPVEPVVDEDRGYSSLLLTGLSPGTYLLGVKQAQRDCTFWQEIALTVAASRWRTEVYMDSVADDWTRRRFDIETAGVLIVPGESGGSLNGAAARPTEIARLALLEGRIGVNERMIARLLRDTEFMEPMLTLYTAYALSMARAPDVDSILTLCGRLREFWTGRSADVKMLERWCTAKGAKSAPPADAEFTPDEVPMIARGWRLSRQLGAEGRLVPAAQYYIGTWRTTGALWTQTQVPDGVEVPPMREVFVKPQADLGSIAIRLVRPTLMLSPLQQTLRRTILDAVNSHASIALDEFVKRFAEEAGLDQAVILSALIGLTIPSAEGRRQKQAAN